MRTAATWNPLVNTLDTAFKAASQRGKPVAKKTSGAKPAAKKPKVVKTHKAGY